jgi:hypothetical protein
MVLLRFWDDVFFWIFIVMSAVDVSLFRTKLTKKHKDHEDFFLKIKIIENIKY